MTTPPTTVDPLCEVCAHPPHLPTCTTLVGDVLRCGCPAECSHGNIASLCRLCDKLYRQRTPRTLSGVKGMPRSIIPQDSIFSDWLELLSLAETPVSFQVLTGLAAFGAALRRHVYVSQVNWHIYPNISILLVGPSGIGKDTAINEAEKFLKETGLPRVYGRTIEAMYDQIQEIGDPACCYIPAPEVTSFLGQKDYQSGMINELTDLLSTKDSHDISTKGRNKISIGHPTVCLMAGSTEEWLHKSMPDGSLEGGWWPRFVIACEEYGGKHVPLLGDLPPHEVSMALAAKERFYERGLRIIRRYMGQHQEIMLLEEARHYYSNWYRNRHSYFSKTVRPYAERSRDQVIRLAMLMALSRGHNYIDIVDMKFAAQLMLYVAGRIDNAVQPPGLLSRIAKKIETLLPCTHMDIMRGLTRTQDPWKIDQALVMMAGRGEVVLDKETGIYSKPKV